MKKTGADKQTLKKWIVLLLSVSCLAVVLLHISEEPPPVRTLSHSSMADSLLTVAFNEAGIPGNRISSRQIEIDSTLSRRIYSVELPPGMSATKWHYDLQKILGPYGLRTPSKVTFPEMTLNIHLTYGTNVIRTVTLQQSSD